MTVFQRPQVQSELKLTDTQKARIKDLDKEWARVEARMNEDYAKAVKELGDPPDRQDLIALQRSRFTLLLEADAKYESAMRKLLDRCGGPQKLDSSGAWIC
jgi:hypothetical protein